MGKKTITSNIKATLHCNLQKVWNAVTSLTEYSWRSDLSRIEVLSDTQFVEITKDGYRTLFTITVKENCHRWEFDMENDKIKGHWVGLFLENEGKTTIDFTECLETKKFFPKLFIRIYLKIHQIKYVKDLKRFLESSSVI
ncbi:polyketide cyclase [Prevotella sp. OH937_COT-195]|uniref:polyketide cyclase n=1 Tax=Prevotella sp. OH937_COT-195 TaxID=2491051 RepID=UPI000F651F2F|nr:polyketide cyclase [Prevotella sp. OH937_COT-195]RRD03051.1 polyketide cyclase [Prevotella sp. OH937_COT-195]